MSAEQRFHAVNYRLRDGVAVLTMDNPPVNALSHSVRLGLVAAFEHAIADVAVSAIVLAGAGRGFSAGGDIREFGSPAAAASPALSLHVHPVIERSPKVTVAAMHGLAMGGGLETALVCHFRLAAADTRIALPEIGLGLIPLSGTQRLPRVLGLEASIAFILEAQTEMARDFARDTLFDAVIEGGAEEVIDAAVAFARNAAERQREQPSIRLPLIRDRPMWRHDAVAILDRARRRGADMGPTAAAAVEAVAATVEAPDFDAGMQRAREIFDRLMAVIQRRGVS
jgi:3-hydroxyacyl-CoA dehydrogenase